MVVSTCEPSDVVPLIKWNDPSSIRQKLNTEATVFAGRFEYFDVDGTIR